MQTWDTFWVCVSQFLFWVLHSCPGTKWLPLVQFLGLSSLFQWFGSPLKCKQVMQILANYEKEPPDCRAGQTGLAGGICNVDGCCCEPMYSWEVTILACQTWLHLVRPTWQSLCTSLQAHPHTFFHAAALSQMLLHPSFLFKSYLREILQYFPLSWTYQKQKHFFYL